MATDSNNGHGNLNDVVDDAHRHIAKVGNREHRYGNAYTNGDGADTRSSEGEEPPHGVKRHPEDPPHAYEAAAKELADPELIRSLAVPLGKTSQALGPERFEWLVRPLYRAIHDIRIGAIVGPARRKAGDQLKVTESTEAEISKITREGTADEEKADRVEQATIPRVEDEIKTAKEEAKAAEEEVIKARSNLADVRAQNEVRRANRDKDEKPPRWKVWNRESRQNLFARIPFSARKAWLVFLVEVLASAYLLAPNVADVVGTSFEVGLLISAVISIAMLSAAFAAGTGLAAIRMPGWAAGVAIIAAFAGILVKFVPSLDALRKAAESGIETLTAATLAALLIALVSGYTLAVAADQRSAVAKDEEEQDLLKRAGTPLGDAIALLAEKLAKLKVIEDRLGTLERLRSDLWETIENLRDSAARADAVGDKRRVEGIKATVEAETIRGIAEVGIEQEEASAEAATIAALFSYEKARQEELPHASEISDTSTALPVRTAAGGSDGVSPLQYLALGVAAVSGLASFTIGLPALGVGIPLAALIAVAGRLSRSRQPSLPGSDGAGFPDQHPPIIPSADAESPVYVYQPDHMVPKYRDGGAGVGRRN